MVRLENDIEYAPLPGEGFFQLPWITTPLLYSKGLSDAAGWSAPPSYPQ